MRLKLFIPLILILLGTPLASADSVGGAGSETNIPVGTNDWTVAGKVYHNVKVGAVESDRVHITYDGGIGTVLLSDLPPDLQKRFNYDPAAAKAMAHQREQQAAQSDTMANAVQAQGQQVAADNEKTKQMLRHALKMSARVKQVVGGGLLMLSDSVSQGYDLVSHTDVTGGQGLAPYDVFFLKNAPQHDTAVEGDRIWGIVVRDGSYEFTDTSGATQRIVAYSYYEATDNQR